MENNNRILQHKKWIDVVCVIGLILVGILTTLPYWNAKGDDAFITFRFVKNLVEYGQLAYNLGEPIYGFTSPVWLGILAAVYAIVRDMYLSVWIACFLSLTVCVTVLWVLATRIIESYLFRILAIAFLLVDPWFIRWAFAGQEISFKIAVCAGLMWVTANHIYRIPITW
jgi:hypothetical protein